MSLFDGDLIPFEYRTELYGWRKLWARLRGQPWAWALHGKVTMGKAVHVNGRVSVPFAAAGPLTMQEIRGWQ